MANNEGMLENDIFALGGERWQGVADLGIDDSGARVSPEDLAAYEAVQARLSTASMAPVLSSFDDIVEMHLSLRNIERRLVRFYNIDDRYSWQLNVTGHVLYVNPMFASGLASKPPGAMHSMPR